MTNISVDCSNCGAISPPRSSGGLCAICGQKPQVQGHTVVACLNLVPVPFPLGYAYLRRWERFWIVTLFRIAAVVSGAFVALMVSLSCWDSCGAGNHAWTLLALLSPLIIVLILTSWDAYNIDGN